MRFKPSISLLLLALFGAGDASALGLGQITVSSRLGARFQAEVELLGVPGDGRPIAECFRLTPPTDAEAGIPVLARGRVSVERQNGRARLLISSEQFVNEPVIQISVRAGCGAEVVRDYTLIIDPAETKAAKPPPAVSKPPVQPVIERPQPTGDMYPDRWQAGSGESAFSIASNLFPHQPSAQRRFLKALQAANPEIEMGSRGEIALAAGTPLSIPDTRRRPPAFPPASTSTQVAAPEQVARPAPTEPPPARSKKEKPLRPSAPVARSGMSDRLSISGGSFEEESRPDGLPLRLATELSLRTLSRTTDNQRSVLRLEYKLLTAIYDQATQQLNLAEQVRQLETAVAELQAATENAAHPPPLPVEPQPAPVAAPAQPQIEKEMPAAQPTRRAKAESVDDSSGWFWLAGLLAAIALLVWMLRRHALRTTRPAPVPAAETPPPEEELPWAIEQTAQSKEALLWDIPDAAPVKAEAPKGAFTGTEFTLPREAHQDQEPAVPPPTQTHAQSASVVTEHYEFQPIMELADIMLSFGRVNGATEALLEYINANPDEALQPWMKLLEIYRQNGMRQDYENLSQKLKLHFNVDPTHWDLETDSSPLPAAFDEEESVSFETLLFRLPNIGQIPHIKEKMSRIWGTPECLAYVNNLLRNNRRGELQRRGFTLSTVSELLFLLDVLEKRLMNP